MDLVLVYVHLGEKLPRYLEKNIFRSKSLFPDLKIVLAGQGQPAQRLAARLNVEYFELETDLGNPAATPEAIRRSGFDLVFWDGYWQKTFDRLLALEAVHKSLDAAALLHIESDVILMPDFPFEFVSSLNSLSWVGFSEEDDIASVVFSPNAESSAWLAEKLIQVGSANPSMNDMKALNAVRQNYPDQVALLPSLPDRSQEHAWAFDGLHFGDWLFGWDPGAHWGFKRRRMPTTQYSPEVSRGKFTVTDNGLVFRSDRGSCRIANLHVHSKEMRFFKADIQSELRSLVVNVAKKKTFDGFSPSAALNWTLSRAKRWSRSIWSLESWKQLVSRQ